MHEWLAGWLPLSYVRYDIYERAVLAVITLIMLLAVITLIMSSSLDDSPFSEVEIVDF